MASLKFRHYATENALIGSNTLQVALNAMDVGDIVFIDDTQKQYIITAKNKDNVVTYSTYYGKAAITGVTGSDATRTLTFSDGSEITMTINNIAHATSADSCSGNANSANTLQTARKINGTDFNGSADITTANWGTARNIGIVNSDGTGTAVTVSVNGSGNVNLNLPSEIKANLSGNASSATQATNDGSGNVITTTYATKTERSNNDITAASLTASKLTLTRAAGNIEANVPTWNQDTTGKAAKATGDEDGNNIKNTYATKAEVGALPKSMIIKGTLDGSHALPTSGAIEGHTYIVGASGTYNGIACKVGDFFVRTSNDSWLRIPAGDEWDYNENTIKGVKVNNASNADTADAAKSVPWTGVTGKPNVVTTDTEQTITGNKSFKNETTAESLTTGSLLVTGSARFINNIQGSLIGDVTGYLNGNISGSSATCSGNAGSATKLQTARTIWGNSFDGSGNVNGNISYTGKNATYEMIKFINNTSDTYGNGIAIGGGGLTIIGGGESSDVVAAQHGSGGDENMVVANDQGIEFYSNLQNGWDSRKSGSFGTDGIWSGAGFKKDNSGSTYVLTGDGGHALISGLSVSSAATAGTATTASACTGNAATATTLQTSRTIWGQSFNGGGNIEISSTATMPYLLFKRYDTNGSAGYVGRGSGSHNGVQLETYTEAPIDFDTNSTFRMRITANGNVGIGTISPSSKFHVVGAGYFTGDISSAANITAGGYIKGEMVKISSGCTLQYDSTQKCVKFVF